MIKGLENLPFKERLKELCLFTLDEDEVCRDLILLFHHLESGYREDRSFLFKNRKHVEKTRANGYKLHQNKFDLDIRNILLPSMEQPPQGCSGVPVLNVFKTEQGARISSVQPFP